MARSGGMHQDGVVEVEDGLKALAVGQFRLRISHEDLAAYDGRLAIVREASGGNRADVNGNVSGARGSNGNPRDIANRR
jgi:hypothetical protein